MIVAEVTAIDASLQVALAQGTWSVIPERPPTTASWQEYEPLVAARVGTAAEWREIGEVFADVATISHLSGNRQPHAPLNPIEQRMFEAAQRRATTATSALAPYVRGEHYWRFRLKRRIGLAKAGPPQLES